jgi:5'-phosphate synthase pdxT subunit
MISKLRFGILSYHGDVIEHKNALIAAATELNLEIEVVEVRSTLDLSKLSALIIPGGESNIMYKLANRYEIFEKLKQIPCIFGTCAGAIMLSKEIEGAEEGQKSLSLLDIKSKRNAYGRQSESFETLIHTSLGDVTALFIRAPVIEVTSKKAHVLAIFDSKVVAVDQETSSSYFLATTFHPELNTTLFHKHFIKKVLEKVQKV